MLVIQKAFLHLLMNYYNSLTLIFNIDLINDNLINFIICCNIPMYI